MQRRQPFIHHLSAAFRLAAAADYNDAARMPLNKHYIQLARFVRK
jgi:hypothetical protein